MWQSGNDWRVRGRALLQGLVTLRLKARIMEQEGTAVFRQWHKNNFSRFGWTYRLHLQGRKIRERETRVSRWLQTGNKNSRERNQRVQVAAATCSRWFLAGWVFYPEDGGDTFLPHIGSHKICTAPHPTIRHSSSSTKLIVQLIYHITVSYKLGTRWENFYPNPNGRNSYLT
jgi:hypothetical protein